MSLVTKMQIDRGSMPEQHDPRHFDGGFFIMDEATVDQQQQATEQLPDYKVMVINRVTHKDLGETEDARFTQEKVRFSDGAVRLLSRAEPKSEHFGSTASPYSISAGDALFTGPKGVNNELLVAFAGLGYSVEWLHHQGRHSVWPTSRQRMMTMARFLSGKSVAKSAHHDHALLDHIAATGGASYDTDNILRDGFSRSAMSGEAFVALAPHYGRNVPFSDLVAKCFAEEYDTVGSVRAVATQLPKELVGLSRLVTETVKREVAGERGALLDMASTFDMHPLNVAHELAWIRPLVNGDSGVYSKAIPLDTVGVRGFLSRDDMSQFAQHQLIHAAHPNLALIVDPGSHVEGVNQAMLAKKVERFRRVMDFMRNHDMTLDGITPADFLPADQSYWLAGEEKLPVAA